MGENGNFNNHHLQRVNLLPQFPLMRARDLEQFSANLGQSAEMQEQFRTMLLSVGGEDLKKKLDRAMKTLMTYRLARRFSWLGKGGRRKFKDFAVADVLMDVFVGAEFGGHYIARENISNWLRRAPRRYAEVLRRGMPEEIHNDSSAESD